MSEDHNIRRAVLCAGAIARYVRRKKRVLITEVLRKFNLSFDYFNNQVLPIIRKICADISYDFASSSLVVTEISSS